MTEQPIKYYLPSNCPDLSRGTAGASGFDLRVHADNRILHPGERLLVPTGLHLDMMLGVEAQIRSRSGMANSFGICVLNAPGTIDADYRGEVKVNLINLGEYDFEIVRGERIAQLVFCPVFHDVQIPTNIEQGVAPPPPEDIKYANFLLACVCIRAGLKRVASCEELSPSVRGPGGFGSTGRG